MKSVQTKGKSKQKNEKHRKVKFSTKNINSAINPDLSSLRKPIDTSVSDLYQVTKLLENGTDEVKSILSYECDIIYECRMCRSLFRSIINLISHKRQYCRDKFDITLHRGVLNSYNLHSAQESTIHMYKTEQMVIKDDVKNDRILRSQVSKETQKKDLSTVIDILSKKRKKNMEKNFLNKLEIGNVISEIPNDQYIYLESIDTNNAAVYQTVKSSDAMADNVDLMKEQVTELQNMTDQHAVASEGQILENQSEKSDSPIQLDMCDEETELLIHKPIMNNLACNICNAKFSTRKTLTVHVKTLHTLQRLCYPCPCCTSTFANTWSVYRHLYKVHRKSNEQVRKLRPQIQEQAFRRETTTMKDSENSRMTKTSAVEDVTTKDSIKTRGSINHVESNVELQICGKRGQRLSRKRVLPARMQMPVNIIATDIKQSDETSILLDSMSNDISCDTEDIDTEISTIIKPSDKRDVSNINSECVSSSPEINESDETSIQVQTVSSLSKEDWNKLENGRNCLPKCNKLDDESCVVTSPNAESIYNKSLSSEEKQDKSESNEDLELCEITCININETSSIALKTKGKRRKITNYHNEKQPTDPKEDDVIEVREDNSKRSSCSMRPNEMNPISIMENKIASIANLQKLQCLPCKKKFTSMPNLRRHMAIHIGWNRYRCKLCDFKCFVKCDCVAHCNRMHNAQNNRAIITGMVIEIPQNEYTCNEDIIMEIINPLEKTNEPDIMDTISPLSQTEIYVNVDDSNDVILQEKVITREQIASRKNVECSNENGDAENGNKTRTVEDMEEYMMNCGSGKLDAHPDLKRMIMEVILGSDDTNTAKDTNSEKPTSEITNDTRECLNSDDNEMNNDNESSVESIEKFEEPSCSMSVSLKHQRPIRNRIRPLSDDFIYDLKEVALRKGCALFNESGTLQHARKRTKLYD